MFAIRFGIWPGGRGFSASTNTPSADWGRLGEAKEAIFRNVII
jgi:hypothetical protein